MIAVGQTLWFVETDNARAQRQVTVTQVGRKWAKLSGVSSRLDVASMKMEPTGYGHGREGDVYLSQADCLSETESRKAWAQLRDAVSMRFVRPNGVEAHHIFEARKLLGLL